MIGCGHIPFFRRRASTTVKDISPNHHTQAGIELTVDKLRKKLTSSSVSTRRKAVEEMMELGLKDPSAASLIMPILLEAIKDQDDGVSRRAGFAIYKFTSTNPTQMKEHLNVLNGALSYMIGQGATPKFESYYPFVSVLNAYGPIAEKHPEALYNSIPYLTKCLDYPLYHPENPHWGLDQIYSGATRTLGLVGGKRPDLVRQSIVILNRTLGDAFKYSFFKNQKPDDPNGLWSCASKAMAAIGFASPQVVIPCLIKSLNDTNEDVQHYSQGALDKLFASKPPAEVVPYTILMMNDDSIIVREKARGVLEGWGKKTPQFIVPSLVNCFQNPAVNIRINAAHVLGEVGKANPNFVASALSAMSHVLIKDPEKDVRQNVADALFKICEMNVELMKPFTPATIEALKDSYHHVRWRAAMLVGLIGSHEPSIVKDALPILLEMYRDSQEHVRWRAEEAVKSIGVDKSEYLMAVKGIQQIQILLDDNKRKGIATQEEEELLQQAREAFQQMRYKEAISLSDQSRNIIIEAMKAKRAGGGPRADAMAPPAAVQVEMVYTQPVQEGAVAPPYVPAGDEAMAIPVEDEEERPGGKFCPFCGTHNQADYNFCMKCHKPLPRL